MRILIAPNALKGSCTAATAAAALGVGAARAAPMAELVLLPVADGGDGLLDVVAAVLGAEQRICQVHGPRGTPGTAALGWLPTRRTALIEMALASGLALLAPAARDPLLTSSRGTGELLRQALDLGAERIILGLGGSATNDGGVGLASALGWGLPDAAGRPVEPVGGRLGEIARLVADEVDPRLDQVRIEAICDVDNPLLGPRGAARVYAPQKGADAAAVVQLEAGLAHLARLMERDLGLRLADQPGAGAAGGLGAGLVAFCGATLCPGAELVLDLVGLDQHLAGADLVLTAEGRLDAQSVQGKAPGAVAAHAARLGVPCIGIAGSLGTAPERTALHAAGFTALFSLCPGPIDLLQAQARSAELLAAVAEQAVRTLLSARAGHGHATDRG
ncbi:MAG: glycerate kinase [Chromatiaceae bacterium]|nr:MAG: glycerate kinase [Chromatiaceae bacterium]